MGARGIAFLAVAACLAVPRLNAGQLVTEVRRVGDPDFVTRPVPPEPPADEGRHERRSPRVHIVRGRSSFDYDRMRHDRGRDVDIVYTLPGGGYWRSREYYLWPGRDHGDWSRYLFWPGSDRTTIIIGFGASRRVGSSYYVYDPGPYLYLPPYEPVAEDPARLIKLDTPTARTEPDDTAVAGAGVSAPGVTGTFESRLSPSLGGRSRVDVAFALGESKLRERAYNEAASAFIRSASTAPADPVRRLALCLALAGGGHYQSAASSLRQALPRVAGLAELSFRVEEVFADRESFEGITESLGALLEGEAATADLRLLLGFLHFATGDDGAAAAALSETYSADALDPLAAQLLLAAEERLRAREQARPPEATGAD